MFFTSERWSYGKPRLWRLMCVKISLVKFTDEFPVFWLLSCILRADCFAILSVLLFWSCSYFAYVRSFWMRSHFECVLILKVFSFWVCSHFDSIPRPHARLIRSHSPLFEEKDKMAQVSSQGHVGVLEGIPRSLTSVIWQLQSPDVSE